MKILSSMSGRVFAILLLGVVSSTALTWWLAFGERQKTIVQYRESHSMERAEQLILALDALPAHSRESFLETAPRLGLQMTKLPAAAPDDEPHTPFAEALRERLSHKFKVQYLSINPENCPTPLSPEARGVAGPCEALGVMLHDGTTVRLTVLQPRSPVPPLSTDFFVSLALFLCCIGILAFLISRMTMHPLKQLAQAAKDLGNDINHPALEEKGASEIVQATHAFNSMQSRIRHHIQQRTHMLAAITHDLQTPLTRLRLRLEKVNDVELRDKLIDDLSAMQAMVKEGLDLARSMDSNEPLKPLDLDSLIDSVCADAVDAGQEVSFDGKPGITVMARPVALRRCLINLIDNAVKYGQYAKVSTEAVNDAGKRLIQIRVRDGGHGIPADQLNKVFEPFYRVETSRSRDTGGTGLGLTIAQNIAQQHGGSLQLVNLAEGGLEVRLTLQEKAA
ncbi:ATP-binding protein [Undibacterium sp.]|jgi:signal transduction histidine kinase|uniref:ATP-binding protein n=1 Tax=Undibacterium sp. TaxID=1914977 RepID=UPI002BDD1C43|nr:ATP-binding protein [Undibacterium sp.]HTD06574.1 ATP-binding protein [Undibacterium sp.]